MDTFNDASLTPEQIKMLTLQFMGQHVSGELKELDKNLVGSSGTLKGNTLDPTAILNTIPSLGQPQPVHQPQLSQPVVTAPKAAPQATLPELILEVKEEINKNQLEFSFDESPLSQRIFEVLGKIEKRLSIIEEKLLAPPLSKKKS